MAIYTNRNRPILLECGDKVIFEYEGTYYHHEVEIHYIDFSRATVGPDLDSDRVALHSPNGGNDTMFGILGLTKGDFCRMYYTDHRADCTTNEIDGYWPETSSGHDYEGLTRCVNAMFDLCCGSAVDLDWNSRLDDPAKLIKVITRMNQVLNTLIMEGKVKRYKYRHYFEEGDRDFAEYCLKPYLASGLMEAVKEKDRSDGKTRTIYYIRESKALAEMLNRFARINLSILAS